MRSYLVIRYIHHCRFIPITLSHRHGIYLSFTGIVIVILTIPEISLPPLYEMMLQLYLYIVFIYVLVEIATENVSFLNITVDIELESLDRSHLPLHLVQRVVNGTTIFHLPLDLVQQVVDGLTTFKNYIAANGVSRDWGSAFSSISRGPQLPLPVLMLPEPLLTDMRTLFSLYDHSRHRLQLSEVRGKRIWGSQHGWVVTLGPRYVTQLVHLMTGKRINLPQVQRLAPREEWFCLVHKFNLLKDPTDESTFLVIAIFGPMNSLAFTRAALNRRGEGEWVVVANPENLKFKDVAHFNDQIYALCDNGKLVRFEPDAPLADMVQVIAVHPQDVGSHRKMYLVESLGNLYAVFRNGFLIPSERRHETTSFFVYKFNFNASAWEEVTHLEGHAFFVGDSNSFSRHFPTSIIPSRSDCIYFTDDHWVWRRFPRMAYGGHDVGLFDMATRDILPLKFGKDEPRFYSRPIFVTRNDKL
nr:f-box/kelch-repeat protein [Quercus suber]